MEQQHRQFLVEDWEDFLVDLRREFDEHGDAATARFISNGEQLVEWLRGGPRPGGDVREFLEERLAGFEESNNYLPLALEHDAMVAAIEDMW
jgi:hypothetical protein